MPKQLPGMEFFAAAFWRCGECCVVIRSFAGDMIPCRKIDHPWLNTTIRNKNQAPISGCCWCYSLVSLALLCCSFLRSPRSHRRNRDLNNSKPSRPSRLRRRAHLRRRRHRHQHQLPRKARLKARLRGRQQSRLPARRRRP